MYKNLTPTFVTIHILPLFEISLKVLKNVEKFEYTKNIFRTFFEDTHMILTSRLNIGILSPDSFRTLSPIIYCVWTE